MRTWRYDFKECDRFAIRREEARALLAYDPEASHEEKSREIERQLREMKKDLEEMTQRLNIDLRACLRGRDWKDEWIDDMTPKMRAQEKAKPKKPVWIRD